MSQPLTLAAVDCGTNSIRLLITRFDPETNMFEEVYRENIMVRLGQGVDETGAFNPEAIERTRKALATYTERMLAEGVQRVRMVATSATRDASNRDVFFDMTRERLSQIQPGAQAEVITGEEEAQLSFIGATMDLPAGDGPFCVIDLGGGSTEFVVGNGDAIEGRISTQMGCVRLTERFLRSDPPAPEELRAARDYAREQVQHAAAVVNMAKARTMVGCAGTFTTLSALTQHLPEYNPTRIHLSRLSFEDLRATIAEIQALSVQERKDHPVIHPGRADVIPAGAAVVEEILKAAEDLTGLDSIVISEKDILDGIVASLASHE